DKSFILEEENQFQALFYGLGSDGTVGANKNTIKIIGTETDNYAQGYFVYDSNKSGTMTVSHVRFGSTPIKSSYLIERANFIAVHQAVFLEKLDILEIAHDNGVFLLNTQYPKEQVWDSLPKIAQQRIIEKNLKFYAIDAHDVAKNSGMGRRTNTIMQTCFFAISGILPKDEAIDKIKHSIEKTYSSKGKKIVEMNFHAVDNTLDNLFEIEVPKTITSQKELAPSLKGDYDEFMARVTKKLVEFKGDDIPVSDMPDDGTWPLGTTQYQKRNTGIEIPVWDSDICIQCNKCVTVCPHSVIRSKVFDKELLDNAPDKFGGIPAKGKIFNKSQDLFNITVSIEDCTGCSLCVEECPAVNKEDKSKKAINMTPKLQLDDNLTKHWDYFLNLPNVNRDKIDRNKMKEAQFLEPLFEFSGACPGCGETPYLKLASQLFGDRMVVANATGCSSIYGGNLPTTPWKKNAEGRGVAWSNSLFEDNAEFGLGFRLSIDNHTNRAKELLSSLDIDSSLKDDILNAEQTTEEQINRQRDRVEKLKSIIKDREDSKELLEIADYLVKKSVWIIGGDGWAYDIGYGGLDHVLASGKNVNILVLDTQVYSNTGGQQSKATMTGAVAKFASGGKASMPKDLAHMAITYENVYVAKVSMGANEKATLKAFMEAEAYEGVSIIIAYSHCIAHGYDLRYGMEQQRKAVDSGLWPLFRFNPKNIGTDTNPLTLDYKGA
ncbi:MAG TPA: pyruvate:ferredoxin (flavodoxin) oxidoreductase, partial [Campylobacterales bacterium]|nr:pyruvate:ferredoxin (flavodoxin) oxidoreductase [Campylobacterales bacterium]